MISLRTINRNFKGRSGTNDAGVYLVSPEVAALSAIKGYLSCQFEDDMSLEHLLEINDINLNEFMTRLDRNGYFFDENNNQIKAK